MHRPRSDDDEARRDFADSLERVGGAAVSLSFGALALFATAACSSFDTNLGAGATETAELTAAFEVPGATTSSVARGRAVATDVTVSPSNPSFTVDSVDVVVRELQAGRQGTACDFGSDGSNTGGDDANDCEEFNVGTVVQTLPVDEGTEPLTTIFVEPGTFDRFVFEFNKLEAGEIEDTPIISERQDLTNASILILGTFEGSAFELKLDPDGEQVVNAASPLTLGENGTGTITLVWDVASWFADGSGGLLDPSTVAADAQAQDQVETNVIQTLKVTTSN